nr:MAG TPA: hypothetical protein [Caudoviricetes sp.]
MDILVVWTNCYRLFSLYVNKSFLLVNLVLVHLH